jgi:Right handed beta helix region
MLFGPVSRGALIVGDMVANVKAIGSTSGTGIYFAGPETLGEPATSNHTVTGNVIKNWEGSAIANGGLNSDIVISGNIIENTNSVVLGAAIQLTDAQRIIVTGNNISETVPNAAIAMAGNSDNWQITQNYLEDNAVDPISLRGTGSVVINNAGYNPVGDIPDPWPASGADLTNEVIAGSPNPQSGIVYTVRHSPKTIVVTGGDLSQITINGVDTGLIAGVFKLEAEQRVSQGSVNKS